MGRAEEVDQGATLKCIEGPPSQPQSPLSSHSSVQTRMFDHHEINYKLSTETPFKLVPFRPDTLLYTHVLNYIGKWTSDVLYLLLLIFFYTRLKQHSHKGQLNQAAEEEEKNSKIGNYATHCDYDGKNDTKQGQHSLYYVCLWRS